MWNSFLAVLTSLTLLMASSHISFAQSASADSSQMKQIQAAEKEKLKQRVEKIGVGKKITVIRLDGREFYGSVSNIETDGFQIYEVDLRQPLDFKYTELKKVRKGYGGKNYAVGKRVKAGNNLLYGAAVLGALFLILGVALSQDK
jgi:hypothetical protein